MFYLPLRDQWILQNMLAKPLSIEYRVSDCTRFIRWLWRGCLGLGRWLMGSRESICCCSRHRGLRVHDRKKFEQVLSVLVRQLPVQSGNCRGRGYIHACKLTFIHLIPYNHFSGKLVICLLLGTSLDFFSYGMTSLVWQTTHCSWSSSNYLS